MAKCNMQKNKAKRAIRELGKELAVLNTVPREAFIEKIFKSLRK